jgi:hypothetical protein
MNRIISCIRSNETIGIIVLTVEPTTLINRLMKAINNVFPTKGLVQVTKNKLLYGDGTKIIVEKSTNIECMLKGLTLNNLFIQDTIRDETKKLIKDSLIPVLASVGGSCFEFTWPLENESFDKSSLIKKLDSRLKEIIDDLGYGSFADGFEEAKNIVEFWFERGE